MTTTRSFAIVMVALTACGEVASTPGVDAGDVPVVDGSPDVEPDAAPVGTLALALEHVAITAPRAIGVEIDVTLVRDGIAGDVVVTLTGAVPTGVTAAPLTIADGASSGTFVVDIGATAALATSTLTVEARPTRGAAAAGALALTISRPRLLDLAWASTGLPRRSRSGRCRAGPPSRSPTRPRATDTPARSRCAGAGCPPASPARPAHS